jgi:hypothetical protein
MYNFNVLLEKYLSIYEQSNSPTGVEIVNDFKNNAQKALKQIIIKYFDAVKHNAAKYRLGDKMQGELITPEKFIQDVIEPLAIDNEENYVVELPVHFTSEVFKDFIRGLSDLTKIDLPDLIEIEPTEKKYASKNIFTNVSSNIMKHIYPRGIKLTDRTNYPGGETASKVLKFVEPDRIKGILDAYRLEHTQKLTENGEPNGVITFLSTYILPLLRGYNWPIKDYSSFGDIKNAQKWGSLYLRDFLQAAEADISNRGFRYQPATGWKGQAEETYGYKQKLRELLDA